MYSVLSALGSFHFALHILLGIGHTMQCRICSAPHCGECKVQIEVGVVQCVVSCLQYLECSMQCIGETGV